MILRKFLIRLLLSLAAVLIPAASPAADRAADNASVADAPGQFLDRVFTDTDGEHRYVVFLPHDYTPAKNWPVILSLHGAGERGRDGRRQLTVGLGAIAKLHPEAFSAVIVFPQVEALDERILTAWSPENPDGKRALRILAEVERSWAIDPRRRILAGWSMGGYGVWQIAAASEPGFWSAAICVSGGATAGVAAGLPNGLPFWALHGANDRLVEPSQMKKALDTARSAGRSVFSHVIEEEGHDVWRIVFGREEVREWMLDPASVDPRSLDWSPETIARLVSLNPLPGPPFRTSAIISRAVAVRIGNEAFAELARGVPEAIPRDRLEGTVKDIERSLDYGGATIKACIRDIRWSAELAAAEVRAAEAERLVIRIGLRNLTLHAAGGELSGGGYEAGCGPFDVVLGRRRPVWVEVTARPRVRDGQIQLTEREIRFSIPDDNWFVTEPAWAKSSGEELTPDLVKVGVVGGMYRAKESVEAAVCEIVPPLIERIEQRLVQAPPSSLASLLWPLTIAPPRVRLIPEGIRTDAGGVSVTVGLAIEGFSPSEVVTSRTTSTPIREGESQGALIGIAPIVLSSAAAIVAEDATTRIDLRDLPDSPLEQLGDESLLRDIAPGLTDGGADFELRTVLSLPQPFQLELEESAESASGKRIDFRLHAPEVLLEVSRRPRDQSRPWTKCVECRISVSQKLSVKLNGPLKKGRLVTMDWADDPVIQGSTRLADGFSPSDQTLHGQRLVEAFSSAWTARSAGADTTSKVDDLAVGGASLRLNGIPTRGGRIWLEFEPTP